MFIGDKYLVKPTMKLLSEICMNIEKPCMQNSAHAGAIERKYKGERGGEKTHRLALSLILIIFYMCNS